MTQQQSAVETEPLYAAELREIQRANDGLLSPAVAVSWARDHPESDLHRRLEWNDERCGEQWRLQQMRQLIVRVRLTIETPENISIRARQFVSLTADRHSAGGYRQTETVLSDPARRATLLREALAELMSFRRKYACLQELASVVTAIDQATSKAS